DWFTYRWGRPSLLAESLVTTEMRYSFNVTRFMMDRGSFAVFYNPNVPTQVKLTHIFLWFHYFIAPFALTLLVLLPALSPFSAFAFLKPLLFFVGTSYLLMEAINLNNLNRHWRESGSFWQAVHLMLRDAILALPFYVFLIPFFFRGVWLASLEMFSFLRTVKEALLSSWNERQRYEELMLFKIAGPRGIPFNGLVGIAGLIAWTIGLVFMTPLAPIILLPYLLASIAFLTGMYVIDAFEHGPKQAGLLYGYSFWAMFTRVPSVIGRTYRHLRASYSAQYNKDKYVQAARDRAIAQGVKAAEVTPNRPISVDEIAEIVQGRKDALARANAVKTRLHLTEDLAPKTTAQLKVWTAQQEVGEQVASGTRYSLAAARLATAVAGARLAETKTLTPDEQASIVRDYEPFMQGTNNRATRALLEAHLASGDYEWVRTNLTIKFQERSRGFFAQFTFPRSALGRQLRGAIDRLPAQSTPEVVARRAEAESAVSYAQSHPADIEGIRALLTAFFANVNRQVAAGVFQPYYAQQLKAQTYRAATGGDLQAYVQRFVFDHYTIPRTSGARLADVSEAERAALEKLSDLFIDGKLASLSAVSIRKLKAEMPEIGPFLSRTALLQLRNAWNEIFDRRTYQKPPVSAYGPFKGASFESTQREYSQGQPDYEDYLRAAFEERNVYWPLLPETDDTYLSRREVMDRIRALRRRAVDAAVRIVERKLGPNTVESVYIKGSYIWGFGAIGTIQHVPPEDLDITVVLKGDRSKSFEVFNKQEIQPSSIFQAGEHGRESVFSMDITAIGSEFLRRDSDTVGYPKADNPNRVASEIVNMRATGVLLRGPDFSTPELSSRNLIAKGIDLINTADGVLGQERYRKAVNRLVNGLLMLNMGIRRLNQDEGSTVVAPIQIELKDLLDPLSKHLTELTSPDEVVAAIQSYQARAQQAVRELEAHERLKQKDALDRVALELYAQRKRQKEPTPQEEQAGARLAAVTEAETHALEKLADAFIRGDFGSLSAAIVQRLRDQMPEIGSILNRTQLRQVKSLLSAHFDRVLWQKPRVGAYGPFAGLPLNALDREYTQGQPDYQEYVRGMLEQRNVYWPLLPETDDTYLSRSEVMARLMALRRRAADAATRIVERKYGEGSVDSVYIKGSYIWGFGAIGTYQHVPPEDLDITVVLKGKNEKTFDVFNKQEISPSSIFLPGEHGYSSVFYMDITAIGAEFLRRASDTTAFPRTENPNRIYSEIVNLSATGILLRGHDYAQSEISSRNLIAKGLDLVNAAEGVLGQERHRKAVNRLVNGILMINMGIRRLNEAEKALVILPMEIDLKDLLDPLARFLNDQGSPEEVEAAINEYRGKVRAAVEHIELVERLKQRDDLARRALAFYAEKKVEKNGPAAEAEGARLAQEAISAPLPAFLRPVTVGLVAAPEAYAAREAALRELLGAELGKAFSAERLDPDAGPGFAAAAPAGTFRVLVDESAFAENAFSNPSGVLDSLVAVARARQARLDAELGRQEAVMAAIAELAPGALAANGVDEAVLALKMDELQKTLSALPLPSPSRFEPVRTTAGLELFTAGRQVSPVRIDEGALSALLEQALDARTDEAKVDAARRALSLMLDAMGEPADADFAARARDAVRAVLASYAALVAQQTLLGPTDAVEGEKTIAVMENMYAGNEAEYNREAAYLQARNRDMKLALIVPMTDAWRALPTEADRQEEYRRRHPEAGAFRIVFSENASSLDGIGRDIQGPFILAGREEIAAGRPDTTREALLMQLDGQAKTHDGVLVVAAKVLYGGKEIAIPGLQKIGEGLFRYLPAISPLELFKLLKQANTSLRAIGAAA
ncbi:MAG TPA: hypothetical protein VL404_09565, partial [Candidatus Eisenbacteria bacterium]|nr:hypothetical protein [Candidatus Eisenbacteria bacterium]